MRNALKYCLLLFCNIFLLTEITRAQDLSFYRIDDEDGLPSNEVYQTLQDQFGYIWVACDAGLFRYDGVRFKEFSSSDQNSRSISNLQLDKKGQLYCQNFTGQVFKLSGDSLLTFFDATSESSQYPAFTIDSRNRVWIATDSNIHVLNSNGHSVKMIKNTEIRHKTTGWLAIKYDNNRVICIDKASRFFSFDQTDYTITPIRVNNDIGTRHMFFPKQNGLIIFSEQNPQRKYFVNEIIGNSLKSVRTIQPDNASATHYFYKIIGNYHFMGTSHGLLVTSGNTNFKKHLFGMKVSDIQKDAEGNYWVSTLQDGIVVIPSLDIEVYKTDNSSLSDRNLYHITSFEDQLLLGTYSGEIFTLSPASGKLEIKQRNENAKFRAIRKILFYKGTTFIACGPLLASDRPELNELSSLNNIRDMAIMHGRLYFTTPDRTGFIDLNSRKPSITIIRKKGGKKIACDPARNTVYLACTDGFFLYSNGKLTEQRLYGETLFVASLQVHKGKLWIGTMNDGVFCGTFKNEELVFKPYNWISGTKVKALHLNETYLWVATENGLNRLDLKTGKNQVLNKYDGIDYTEINDLTTLNDKIYLATIRGLVCFPVNINGSNKYPPRIQITEIKKGSKYYKLSNLVNMYPDDHGLTVGFNTAVFRSRGAFYYEYRISGFDGAWKKLPAASPFVYITGLPSGKYKFQVRALNEDGVASVKAAGFDLTVHAPFFQKWWFFVLMGVLLLGFVTLIFLLRIRYLKRQALIKNRLVLSQLTALKAQMNPHFMYNTLSSIQDFIWQNDTKNSNYYLSKFSLLMRKILDASDSSKISLNEEIEILSLYLELEQLRFGSSFIFEMTVEGEIDSDHIYIPAMIIQPFVENAIKHGLLHKNGEKKLKVHFSLKENELHCLIVDNGIGRAKAEEIKKRQESKHRSFATKATQKRIELLSLYDDSMYSFTIKDLHENGEPCGTQVELILPFRIS